MELVIVESVIVELTIVEFSIVGLVIFELAIVESCCVKSSVVRVNSLFCFVLEFKIYFMSLNDIINVFIRVILFLFIYTQFP